MNARAGRHKGPRPGALLILNSLIFLWAGCSNDAVNPSLEKRPGPPTLDTLFVTTKNDTEACVRVEFSDSNQLDVSINAYRAQADSGIFRPVEGGRGIPPKIQGFSDVSLFQGLIFKNDFETFCYRLASVSRQDSVSAYSNTDTLRLAKPAEIDSILQGKGYPEVYYRIGGQMGTEWDVEVTLKDTLVLAGLHHNVTFTEFTGIAAFTNLLTDSLKARAQADTLNGTYGVRILSKVGASRGIAVSKFNVFP